MIYSRGTVDERKITPPLAYFILYTGSNWRRHNKLYVCSSFFVSFSGEMPSFPLLILCEVSHIPVFAFSLGVFL